MKKTVLLNIILSIGFSLFLFASSQGQNSKTDTKTKLPVASNEVFESIAQFYKYDQNIALEAQIVAQQEFSNSNREKIIFNGANSSRVPSYLVTPNHGAEKHPVVLIVEYDSGHEPPTEYVQ